MIRLFAKSAALVPLLMMALSTSTQAVEPTAVADFTVKNSAGKSWRLREQKARATVVVFLCCDCPMSNGYLPVLEQIANDYSKKGVTVVGINAIADDSAERIAAHIKEYKISFPVFADPDHAAVMSLKAKTTPEVVVLDDKFVVRYQGRIDDGYLARMKAKPVVNRRDLREALDELLAGKPVSQPFAKAFGCPIPLLTTAPVAPAQALTFHKDILPIIQQNCQSCHRPGQVGPFALTEYRHAVRWGETCLEEMESKRMPPWKAEANPLLAGNRSMRPEDQEKFKRWIAAGMPEGDAKDAPAPPKFSEGWTLGEPDLVLEVPSEVTIGATGKDLFRVVCIPTNLPEDKFISAIEVRPGNARVVHHTLQIADTSGRARKLQLAAEKKADPNAVDRGPGYPVDMGWGFLPDRLATLGGWAPGLLPKFLPAGVAQKLPKGADVCIQFHYHRTGKVETDRTKIGLYFAKSPTIELYRSVPVAGLFTRIPAGDKAFKVSSQWALAEAITAYRVTPHMHFLGKEIELTYQEPGGEETMLIRIPAWDYNWQEQYELKEPLPLAKGIVMRIRATYDNSADNPNNPSSPPKMAILGEQTTNEMCFVFMGVSSKSKAQRLLMPKGIFK